MCLPKPGPRCSKHAATALTKKSTALLIAQLSGDKGAIATAQEAYQGAKDDYEVTKEGVKAIRKEADRFEIQGDLERATEERKRADYAEKRRQEMLDALRKKRARTALQKAFADATNSDTDPKELARLAKNRSTRIRGLVATNESAPTEVLTQLAGEFPHRVALNPSTPAEVVSAIATEPKYRLTPTQFAAYRHPALTDGARRLVNRDLYIARNRFSSAAADALLEDTDTPEHTLRELSRQGYPVGDHANVGVGLAVFLASLSPDAQYGPELQRVDVWDEHQSLLRRTDTHPEVLSTLYATYKEYEEEERVSTFGQIAVHANCPDELRDLVRADLLSLNA